MKDHREYTMAWILVLFLVPILFLLTYLYIFNIGDKTIAPWAYAVIAALFVVLTLLFYGMETRVSTEWITVSYGVGLIRKRIRINRIKSVNTVRSPWYYGWGIRLIPNGWLYNISGTRGVELSFKDTDRIIRIGSKDPEVLKKEIDNRLE